MEQNNNKMTDVQGPTNVIKLHKNDCPTEWVTAFTDRAEVTRLIKTKVNAGMYKSFTSLEMDSYNYHWYQVLTRSLSWICLWPSTEILFALQVVKD